MKKRFPYCARFWGTSATREIKATCDAQARIIANARAASNGWKLQTVGRI